MFLIRSNVKIFIKQLIIILYLHVIHICIDVCWSLKINQLLNMPYYIYIYENLFHFQALFGVFGAEILHTSPLRTTSSRF